MKAGPERELADRYAQRLEKTAPSLGMEFSGIRQFAESRAKDAATRKRDEAKSLRSAMGQQSRLLVFDEPTSALDPELDEYKFYCPGVGNVLVLEGDVRVELIEYSGL
mgnify:CR=1 FL=1